MPREDLHERHDLNCLAAFFALSPFVLKNLLTQALLQNFSCNNITPTITKINRVPKNNQYIKNKLVAKLTKRLVG